MSADHLARFEPYVEQMLNGENDSCLLLVVRDIARDLNIELTEALDSIIECINRLENRQIH